MTDCHSEQILSANRFLFLVLFLLFFCCFCVNPTFSPHAEHVCRINSCLIPAFSTEKCHSIDVMCELKLKLKISTSANIILMMCDLLGYDLPAKCKFIILNLTAGGLQLSFLRTNYEVFSAFCSMRCPQNVAALLILHRYPSFCSMSAPNSEMKDARKYSGI